MFEGLTQGELRELATTIYSAWYRANQDYSMFDPEYEIVRELSCVEREAEALRTYRMYVAENAAVFAA